MTDNQSHPNWSRSHLGLVGIGFFSLSLQPTLSVLVPLWAIYLHASAVQIGVAVAATSVLPFFYAIPIGGLVDRLGSRQLLSLSAMASAALYALYPFFPTVLALIILQFIAGIFQSVNWQAAQAYAAKSGRDRDRASVMARFGAASNLGTAVGPFMAGILTALGFSRAFWGVALWSLLLLASARLLHEPKISAAPRLTAAILVPRIKDFIEAGTLLRSPAIVLVMLVTFLRLGMFSIRQSFFPVFLHGITLSSSQIGLLIGLGSLASSVSAAGIGVLTQRFSRSSLLLGGLAIGIIGQCIVPLSQNYWAQMGFSVGSGLGIGVTLPIMLTMLADVTPAHQRGLSVGLRNGMNRLASTLVPLGLGLLVSHTGLQASFYWVGGFLIAGVGFAVWYQRRALPNVAASEGSGVPG